MLISTEESKKWVNDPVTEKFQRIPSIYYGDRLKKIGFETTGKKILDFGCGSGLITTGIAAYLNPAHTLGVDLELYIDEHENEHTIQKFGFNSSSIKEKIEFRQTKPNEDLGNEVFDCIFSWSVIEHIERNLFNEQISTLHRCLKPGGIAILQSAPLYYSPFGSHVYELAPWSHLYMSESEFISALTEKSTPERTAALLSCKNTLNRFDSEDFTNAFLDAGFIIRDKYSTTASITPPKNLSTKFSYRALIEEQCVWLLSK